MKRTDSAYRWRKQTAVCVVVLLLFALCGCAKSEIPDTVTEDTMINKSADITESHSEPYSRQTLTTEDIPLKTDLILEIDGQEVSVAWEDNDAVAALKELAKEAPLSIQMSMYGGFEHVGSVGTDLPRSDVQTTTQAGDIVLYSGNQIVVFYGSNSWAYTRLGRINGINGSGLKKLLGNGDVTLILRAE